MGHEMTNNRVARGGQGLAAGVACAALLCSGAWGQCEIGELVAPDPQPDMFYGWRVDTTPDVSTVAVAANGRNSYAGGVYVFAFDPDETAWLLQAILTAPDPQPYRRFADDVGISTDGRTILVGEVFDTNEGGIKAGAAFIFTFDVKRSQWIQAAKLISTGDNFFQFMGASVALSADGTRAIAGGEGFVNDAGLVVGAVYVFDMPADGWSDMTETARIVSPIEGEKGTFGCDVAMSPDGGTIVAVNPTADEGDIVGAGVVFVYQDDPEGSWTLQQTLTASDAEPFDHMGRVVAISGDGQTIAAGAATTDSKDFQSDGSAYVFRYDSMKEGWFEEQILFAWDAGVQQFFGYSVDLSADGDTLLIADLNGRLYIFERRDSKWTLRAEMIELEQDRWTYGRGLAITPDAGHAVVGAPRATVEPGLLAGRAFIVDLQTPCPGDIDGDGSVGVSDLLILLASWGLCPDCGDCPADIDGDCTVGVSDLLILLGNWG